MSAPGQKSGTTGWILQFALILGLLLAGTGGLLWLKSRAERLPSNQREAGRMLKVLSSAEADLRFNDRDGNGVNDFWTGDVAGLYRFGLISRELAEADLRPLIPLVPRPIPYHGYYFVAMTRDESETPVEELRQDTDRRSGNVHHLTKFGFSAHPVEYGVTGRDTFIVNENNTIRWRHTYGHVMDYWPSDEDMRHEWALGD